MTTMLAIIGTVAIITVQVIEYNMTEIHIPTAGTFNDDDAEPPHSSVTLVFIRTILINLLPLHMPGISRQSAMPSP